MTLISLLEISEWVFYGFFVFALIQLLYYLVFYTGVFRLGRKTQETEEKVPVSVIIAARNEAENLEQYLSDVLEQDYPDFEVIVVDDASTDDTPNVLSRMKEKYAHLRLTHVPYDPNHHIGKKLALTVGVKAASNEYLLFTDADCRPKSKYWLQYMQRHFARKADFVLGYGGYYRKFGILNRFIRFDTAFIGMQYLTFALRGIPYMGVGRNLAYTRSLFFNNKGFSSSLHVRSGDDDLFVNKLGAAHHVVTEANPEAQVLSEPVTRFRSWRKQKQRHISTSTHYKFRDKFLLTLEPLTRIFFYLCFIALVVFSYNILVVSGVFLLRLIIQQTIFIRWFKTVEEQELLVYSIFLDFLMPVIYLVFLLSNVFVKPVKWH